MKKIFILMFILYVLVSCGGNNNDNPPVNNPNDDIVDNPPQEEVTLLEFSGVTFEDDSIDYDGNPHTLDVEGAPSFADVTYTNKGPHVNAGKYEMTATITAEGYKDLVLNAKLVINKIEFTNLEFNDLKVDYDGNQHSITIEGNLPANAEVVYSSDVDGVTNTATNVGIYNIVATISAPNFKELV